MFKTTSAIILSLLVSGCSTVFTKGAGEIPETIILSQASEIVKRDDPEGASALARRNLSNIELTDKNLIDSPRMEKYLTGIVKKLLTGWPEVKPKYTVQLLYGNSLAAHATFGNNIFLASGWIINAESEDEIAAVLAHEVSHILLKHNYDFEERSKWEENIQMMGALASFGMAASNVGVKKTAGKYKLGKKGDIRKQMRMVSAIGMGIYETKRSLINPLITREQEEEADFLAIDLLAKAGYSTKAFSRVMSMLEAYQASAKERIEQDKLKLINQRQLLQSALEAAAKQGQANTVANTFIREGLSHVSDVAKGEIGEWFGKMKSQHFLPENRKAQANSYLRKHYRKLRRASFKKTEILNERKRSQLDKIHKGHKNAEDAELFLQKGNLKQAKKLAVQAIRNSAARKSVMPWIVLAKVRKAEGRRRDAIENLQIASRLNKTTPDIYSLMADYYTEFNRLDAAQNAIKKGVKKHGEEGLFYYQKASVDLKRGDKASYKAHIKRCKKHPRKVQKGRCVQLESQQPPDSKKKNIRVMPDLNFKELLKTAG